MAHGFGGYGMRGFVRDPSVAATKLKKGTVRRILRFAQPFRAMLIVFMVLVVVDAVLTVLPPLLSERIINQGILRHDSTLITQLAIAVVIIALLDAADSFGQRLLSARIGEGLIYTLRTRVFSHVQRMPIAFFTRTQTGALISRLNSDVNGAQQAFTSVLSNVVSSSVSLVLVAGTMAALSWQITVVSLLLMPLFILPARRIGGRMRTLSKEQMQLNADMATVMSERFNVSGALLAKIYGRPDEDDAEFSARAARVRDIGVRTAMVGQAFFIAMSMTVAVATAMVYLIGGHLAVDGRLSLGALFALTGLLGRLYGPVTSLANVRVTVMSALVSFERVFEVLDLPPMITEKPNAVELPAGPAAVEFENVDFGYPSADEVSLASLESLATGDRRAGGQVLHQVSFRAEPGQMVALVGPSGAGKTTITALASRLYDVTGGAVRVGGRDVRDLTLASLRRGIGVVTQDAHMFHDTIAANLRYAKPDATDDELRAALRAAQIWDLVESLPAGLDTVVGDRGYRLSGGEKQRMAIARLLLKAPDVVVLDEATAHLDSESEVAVQAALATALRGRTSLVIAHRLSTVRDADLIVVVDDGRIVERGTHAELLAADGLYADLYQTQFAGQENRADAPSGADGVTGLNAANAAATGDADHQLTA